MEEETIHFSAETKLAFRIVLDVDLDDPKDVRAARSAVAWARLNNLRCESITGKIWTAGILAIAGVGGGVFLDGIGARIKAVLSGLS